MYQNHLKKLLFCLLIVSMSTRAQLISSKVLDSTTLKPIPYVTVLFNKSGVITNEEGRFAFNLKNNAHETDSLFISCIGFETLAKPLYQFKDSIIYLIPKTVELKEVVLTNKHYTAQEILEKAKENINKNYNFKFTKKKLFYRESNHQNFTKAGYTLKKSTIEALSKPFIDSLVQSIPKQNDYYTEVLCDLYGDFSKEQQKINLIKASELYDKNNEIGFTALEEKFNKILEKNVKPDSYFKIKSGWFGQKVSMDEMRGEEIDSTDASALNDKLDEEKNRKIAKKINFPNERKNSMTSLLAELFFQEKTPLNFIRKSKKYEFNMLAMTYLGDNAVYVIEFKPKGSADYKGTLYVNYDDFAIIRIDYENVKPLQSFSLLGISYKLFLSKGKMIFSKGAGQQYYLQYLESEKASRFGIRRPLKIIEKNKHVKGRRKQNELYLKIDMAMTIRNKNEIVVFDTDNISISDFEGFQEKNTVLPTYMPAYSADFWKGYNIIEPNQAIKNFTIVEE
jgi:hypothetical protein